jgi:hypothetical protein
MVIVAQSGWPVIGQRHVNSAQLSVTRGAGSRVSKTSSRLSARASGLPSLVSVESDVAIQIAAVRAAPPGPALQVRAPRQALQHDLDGRALLDLQRLPPQQSQLLGQIADLAGGRLDAAGGPEDVARATTVGERAKSAQAGPLASAQGEPGGDPREGRPGGEGRYAGLADGLPGSFAGRVHLVPRRAARVRIAATP